MTQHYYGLNRGVGTFTNPDNVTVGTSTGSTDVELRIDDSKGLTKEDVRLIVSNLLKRVMDGRYDETGGQV